MNTSTTGQQTNRLRWVEYSRGIAILTVVLWHVNGGIINAGIPHAPAWTVWQDAWELFAYRFMPLFFFLSGMFAVRTLRKTNGEFIRDKLRTLVYPYVVWSLITMLFGTLLANYTNQGATLRDLPRLLYSPIMHYWFLYALFVVLMAFLAANRAGISVRNMLICALLLYVVGEITQIVHFLYVLGQITAFTVYFVLGAFTGKWVQERLPVTSTRKLAAMAAASFAFVGVFLWMGLNPAWNWIAAFTGLAMISGGIALAELLARKNALPFVAQWGRYSLEIFLMHVLVLSAVRIVLYRALHIENGLLHLVIGTLAGIYIPLLLVWLARQIGFRYLFSLPDALPKTEPASRVIAASKTETRYMKRLKQQMYVALDEKYPTPVFWIEM